MKLSSKIESIYRINNYFLINDIFFYNELWSILCYDKKVGIKLNCDFQSFILKYGTMYGIYDFFFFQKKKNRNLCFDSILTKVLKKYIFYFRIKGRGYKVYSNMNSTLIKLGYSHLCYFLFPLEFFLFQRKKSFFSKLYGYDFYYMKKALKTLQSFKFPKSYDKKGIFVSS
uniref:60S ribosomal protein L6 n=1 Tax=Pleurostomum flabellatum TaxID=405751 RepID=A0A7T0M430_9EUKA|nr:60S ribosomal protein L6 [Pleurostomum flabellatum]QPL15618.1 60S ribosomal protein L6 [Pleurostomum flabellatum]